MINTAESLANSVSPGFTKTNKLELSDRLGLLSPTLMTWLLRKGPAQFNLETWAVDKILGKEQVY